MLKKAFIVFVALFLGFFELKTPVRAAETATDSSVPSVYPTYLETLGFDPTKYYLQPIKGLGVNKANRDLATIREDLLLQGYESYCAAPETSISLELDDPGAVASFLDQYNGVVLDLDSTYALDLKQGLIPLVRDTSRQQFQTTSIEEYFGFKDTYLGDPTQAEVNTAPINSLLSQNQRCEQSVRILLAQLEMCTRLQSSADCALYTRGIPDTAFTVKKLMDEYHAYADAYGTPVTGVGWKNPITIEYACNTVMKAPVPQSGFSTQRIELLRKGLLNTPLYLDRAYRLAFLVAAIERVPPQSQLFNFFAGGNTAVEPKHMVSVVAFKTPDFLTNKGNTETTGAVTWSDASMLTRNVLVPYMQNVSQDPLDPGYILETKKIRNDWEANVKDSPNNPINCVNDPTCKDELAHALVDIINVQKPSCADKPPEYWNVISDSAGLTPPTDTDPSRKYLTDFGEYILKNLFPGAVGSGVERSNLLIESNLNVSNPGAGNLGAPIKAQFYLVYPVGYEYQKTIEALKGSFLTTNQLAVAEASDIKDTFEAGRDTSGLVPGSVTHEFETDCRLKYDPVTGQWKNVCGQDEFTFSTLEQGKQAARFLGARLGFWMRTIQKSLNRFMSGPYVFLTACTTTEDFLLGTCSEGLFPPGTKPGGDLETVAKCDPNSNMGRITSGETAEHVYIPGTQCTKYDPAIHNIPDWKNPSDDGFSCEDLYSYVACTFPETLIQNPVNPQGQFKADGGMTACEYVVQKAKEAGISPKFALAMWGEESGFSSFKVPDFGVISAPAQDLGKQMELFAGTVNSHSSYQSFLEAYGVGQGNEYCLNPYFVARLKTFYDYLGN